MAYDEIKQLIEPANDFSCFSQVIREYVIEGVVQGLDAVRNVHEE